MAGNSSEQCTYLIGKHRIDQSGDLYSSQSIIWRCDFINVAVNSPDCV